MIARRTLVLQGLAVASLGWAGDSWSDKKASDLSEKDVQKLLTHSPWAKEVTLELRNGPTVDIPRGGRRGGMVGGGGMGDGEGDSGGMNGGAAMGNGPGGGRGGRGGGGMDNGGMQNRPEFKTLVRWESAKPIREAEKREMRKEFEENYVLSVQGLRMGGRQGEEGGGNMQDRLKDASQLQRKGADPIHASQVQVGQSKNGPIAFFVFPRGSQPIQASDKDVTFHIAMGRMELKVKFALKDMMYQGELAL